MQNTFTRDRDEVSDSHKVIRGGEIDGIPLFKCFIRVARERTELQMGKVQGSRQVQYWVNWKGRQSHKLKYN